MTIGNRIEEILKLKNLNYRSLGKLIDYSDTQVRNIVIGKSIPKADFFQAINREFPEININWVITGNGELLKEYSYDELNNFNKDDILTYMIMFFDDFKDNPKIELLARSIETHKNETSLKSMQEEIEMLKRKVKNLK